MKISVFLNFYFLHPYLLYTSPLRVHLVRELGGKGRDFNEGEGRGGEIF